MTVQENTADRTAPSMRALERGLAVLKYFTDVEAPATISDIARGTGFDRAVVRRILGTLTGLGYVRQHDGGYVLLPSVLELGYAYLSSDPLPQLVQPRLDALSARTQESSSFGVLQLDRVVYLARAQIKRIAGSSFAVGSVMEPHLTSIGQTLLANLEPAALESYLATAVLEPLAPKTITTREALGDKLTAVRDQGWCLADEELEEGLIALAVPVRASGNRTIGAVNLTSHTSRIGAADLLEKMLPELRDTAATIENDIRHASL